MKKIYYLMLSLLLISTAGMKAQVTIGSQDNPHKGAVLELKSTSKGLLLPRISLNDVAVFQLDTEGSDTAANAAGMVVFNTNASITGGNGIGIYVWDGSKWANSASSIAPVDLNLPGTPGDWVSSTGSGNGTSGSPYLNVCPATTVELTAKSGYTFGTVTPSTAATLSGGKLTFTAQGNVVVTKDGQSGTVYVNISSCNVPVTGVSLDLTTVTLTAVNQTQKLTATVSPDNATDKSVTWTSSDTLIAKVNANGKITAIGKGSITITVTTTDGAKKAICSVTIDTSTPMRIGKNTYGTYTYGSDIWMIENSKEGTSMACMFGNDPSKVNGCYYSWEQASLENNACPSGWHLPSQTEWDGLKTWVNANVDAMPAIWWVTSTGNAWAGCYKDSNKWYDWNENGAWWTADPVENHYGANSSIGGPANGYAIWMSVRCVKDK